MEYNKQADGSYLPLEQKNVDTGMGLDRTICILQGKKSVYDTDVFSGILAKIAELSGKEYGSDEETTKAFRIVADHIRCATFMMGDEKGITPSNTDQGYILRRLIRRAVRMGMKLGLPEGSLAEIAQVVIDQYREVYPELAENSGVATHGGSDFYPTHFFIEKILGKEDGKWSIDVYQAVDMGICGILAFRSILNGNQPVRIPNLRNKEERDAWRNDKACTDPAVAGDQVLPCSSYPERVLDAEEIARNRHMWEERHKQ
mgnify:CR=1 FL=1